MEPLHCTKSTHTFYLQSVPRTRLTIVRVSEPQCDPDNFEYSSLYFYKHLHRRRNCNNLRTYYLQGPSKLSSTVKFLRQPAHTRCETAWRSLPVYSIIPPTDSVSFSVKKTGRNSLPHSGQLPYLCKKILPPQFCQNNLEKVKNF